MKAICIFWGFMFFWTAALFAGDIELQGNLAPGNLVVGKVANAAGVTLNGKALDLDDSGRFLFGFDRDDNGSHHLSVVMKDGRTIEKKIALLDRQYQVQRINNMKQKYVSPPESELARIKRERQITLMAKSRIGQEKNAYYSSGFVSPVRGGRISSVFGSQRVLNGTPKSPHNGLDIALPRGTPVHAMADGKVVLAADNFYYAGNFILLDHGHGLSSIYLHLDSHNVTQGQRVKKGEKIGTVGTTGRSTGAHLHWGVQWFNRRIDPTGLPGLERQD